MTMPARSPEPHDRSVRRMLEMFATARVALRANARAASRHFSWETLQERYRSAFAALESAAP